MRTRGSRALLGVACGAAALFVVLYGFAVWTRTGQRIDTYVVRTHHALPRRQYLVAARLHTWIDAVSITFLGGAIVLTALRRRLVRLAVGIGVLLVGSLATTEILKHLILPRPALGITDALRREATYPSGHTTIAVALALAAVLAAPARWQRVTIFGASVFASAVGSSLVATASHRPSDIIGGACVVVVWASLLTWRLPAWFPIALRHREPHARQLPVMTVFGIGLLVFAFSIAATIVVAVHSHRVPTVPFDGVFLAVMLALTGAIVIALTVVPAIRGWYVER